MFRDFSPSAKQKLLDYVDQVTETTLWGKIVDRLEDLGSNMPLVHKLSIADYVNNVDEYHKKVLDKKNTTKKQVEDIFTKVEQINTQYASALGEMETLMSSYKTLIMDMADTINPNGGNLSKEYMDQVLAADVERIHSAESTKESIVTDELLGTDPEGNAMSTDPVNLATGNFTYEHKDMGFGGEIPLAFHRFYNGKDVLVGSLGKGFRHNYEVRLVIKEDGVDFITEDGQRRGFEQVEQGFIGRGVTTEELVRDGQGYALKFLDGDIWKFDAEGQICRQEDRNGRGVSFAYNEEHKLTEARTDNEDFYQYTYNAQGFLEKVVDSLGRSVELTYDGNKLETVSIPEGRSYIYAYGKDGRISSIKNVQDVVTVTADYDRKGRVTHQDFPDGGEMSFLYDDKEKTVTQIERDGSKSVFLHDDKYRNTEIRYADGSSEKFVYNDRNQKILSTDRNGNTSRMAYDNRGNLVQLIDPLRTRINLTYDGANQLTNLSVNGKEILRNYYDARGNLISSQQSNGSGTSLTYDQSGRLTSMENQEGITFTLTYDAKGNVTELNSSAEGKTLYQYDEANRVVESKDALGHVTAYQYDMADRITKVVNALGDNVTYTYNTAGRVTEICDYDGYQTKTEYNNLNLPSKTVDKEGYATSYNYDKMWNVAEILRPDGGKIAYTYNQDNRLEQILLPENQTLTYAYDPVGNLLSQKDASGNQKSYQYDANNRLICETDEEGNETHYAYDRNGNLIEVKDALGNQQTMTYDELGQLTSKKDVMGYETRYEYLPSGKVSRIYYPNGSKLTLTYEQGRVAKTSHSDGSCLSYTYDILGNLIAEENAMGQKVSYTYDALKRVTGITMPDGGKRTYAYDSVGHVTSYLDENGHETKYSYSPNGNLIQVLDALGNQADYTYDSLGRLIGVKRSGADAEDQFTSYQWNGNDQIVQIVDPLKEIERYEYDLSGNLKAKIDKDGYRTEFTYNKAKDITGIQYADGREVAFSYDALRHLKEMTDWNGKTSIVSDALGRALSVTDSNGKTVAYQWGSMGEKLSLLYPDGKEAKYQYNSNGQLENLILPTGTVSYDYDSFGRLTDKHLPNGITTSYQYNSLNRVAEISHKLSSNVANFDCNATSGTNMMLDDKLEGVLEKYSYTYDLAGNKVSAKKYRPDMPADNGDYAFAYDAMNQLTKVSKDGKLMREYAYDAFGNRSSRKEYTADGILETVYKYNQKNQLLEESTQGEIRTFSYDKRGNRTQVSSTKGLLQKYQFDASNVLSQVTEYRNSSQLGNGIVPLNGDYTDQKMNVNRIANYAYNGLGKRISQKVMLPEEPEQQITYTLDLTRQYFDLLQDSTGTDGSNYYWDGTVVGFQRSRNQNYDSVSQNLLEEAFYLQDDLGSTMGLYDLNGQSRQSYGYDEFGRDLREQNIISMESFLQPFYFTGYQRDDVGDVYFAQARRYDPNAGRFISEDKVRGFIVAPYTMNHYGYCWNRPEDFVDEDGRFPSLGEIKKGIKSAADATGQFIEDNHEVIGIGISVAGLVAGVAITAFCPVAAPVVAGAVMGATGYLGDKMANWEHVSAAGLLVDTTVGAFMGGLDHVSVGNKIAQVSIKMIGNGAFAAAGQTLNNIIEEKDIGEGVLKTAIVTGILSGVGEAISLKFKEGKDPEKMLKNLDDTVEAEKKSIREFYGGKIKNGVRNAQKNMQKGLHKINVWYKEESAGILKLQIVHKIFDCTMLAANYQINCELDRVIQA